MFIAFVLGAAWSGMTAFVLTAALTYALDAVIGKYLRRLAVGRMIWQLESGETRCNPTTRVFKEWGIERSAAAFRTRRLQWHRNWALYPHEHAH
eukprot:1845179-Pyramimonas_sp.AAC.1